jgi:predicted neuraminidase
MTLTQLPNPNSGIDACVLRDGTAVLVYNHTAMVAGRWGGPRSPLNVAISADGHEWSAAAVLEDDDGEYSYPAVIQSLDGDVHVTYTWRRRNVKHVLLGTADLDATAIVDGEWPAELGVGGMPAERRGEWTDQPYRTGGGRPRLD